MTKFVKSNEAVVIGALYAGCDVYFGIPLHRPARLRMRAARWFPSVDASSCRVRDGVDLHGLWRAAAAGRLSMTATSGRA